MKHLEVDKEVLRMVEHGWRSRLSNRTTLKEGEVVMLNEKLQARVVKRKNPYGIADALYLEKYG